jgi:hypothetical protein
MKQAEVDKIYVSAGIDTVNEIREDRGRSARPETEAEQLIVMTANGPVPLEGAVERANLAAKKDSTAHDTNTPKPKPKPKP